jgi:hypothetical protein
MSRGAAAKPGKCAFLPAMRKDAQFFRKDAELGREVWLTSGQLKMNRNPRKQKPQLSKRTPSSGCSKPRPAGKKSAEYFP